MDVQRFLRLMCLCPFLLGAEPPPAQELERLDSLAAELLTLKSQTAAIEARIDAILRALSEQRGALQSKPPAFNALRVSEAEPAPDARKPMVRCAALTSNGKRCTRAASDGVRYCKQHQLAHQK